MWTGVKIMHLVNDSQLYGPALDQFQHYDHPVNKKLIRTSIEVIVDNTVAPPMITLKKLIIF